MILTEVLFKDISANKYYVGLSGGVDSVVLLHLCKTYLPNVAAIHINHGLSPNAQAWASFCRDLCSDWGVPYEEIALPQAPEKGVSVEAWAREQRYAAFAPLIKQKDCLLTAHHQEDQVETFFLQLLRGSGPKGLAAMPSTQPYSGGCHARPLLTISQATIDAYAKEQGLAWVEDESNQELSFDRNYLRQQVLPKLYERWPSLPVTVSRSSELCAQAMVLIDDYVTKDLTICRYSEPERLDLKRLQRFSPEKINAIIRHWLEVIDYPSPSQAQLQQITTHLITASEDANPEVSYEGIVFRRYQEFLYVMEILPTLDVAIEIPWSATRNLILPHGLGVLQAEPGGCEGLCIPEDVRVTVRLRRGGERCQPLGRSGSHPLKKLMQEWNIPPWHRDRIPLIFFDEELAAVVGYTVCEPFHQGDNPLHIFLG